MRSNCLSILCMCLGILFWGKTNAQTPCFFKSGGGTGGNTIPLGQASTHTQLLYAPGDFNILPNSGKIAVIYMRNSAAGTNGVYTGFRVSFMQTTDPSFPSTSYYTTGFSVALPDTNITINGNAVAGGWFYIPLTIPFTYDSTKSLVVDIRYTAVTGGMSTTTSASVGNKRCSGTSLTSLTGTTNTTQNDFGMEVVPANACITPPVPGTATSNQPSAVCAGTAVQLDLTGSSIGAGQSYKWQQSTAASGPYTDISVSRPITRHFIQAPTNSTYFRAMLTCGTASDSSAPVLVSILPLFAAGTYTINPALPASASNFQTFGAAVGMLNCGIAGPIVFDVAAATFNERVTIGAISGASANNPIVFKGAGKATTKISYTSSSTADMATILLDGADHITFRDMTIEATSLTNSVGVLLTNVADSNRFINLRVQMNAAATAGTSAGIVGTGSTTAVTSTGNTANYTLIDSVEIDGGYYGIRFNGVSASVPVTGNKVLRSTLTNQYYYAVYLNYTNQFTFGYNSISSIRYATSSYGMYIINSGNYTITNNKILAAAYGFHTSSTNEDFYNPAYRTLVANNMISTPSTGTAYGLNITGSRRMHILHNTIASNGIGQYATAYFTTDTLIDFRNNILVNNNDTAPSHVMNIAATAYFDSLDYNNYYSAGGGLVYLTATATYNNLTAWKQAVPQFNQNAYSQNPRFVSSTDLNLTPSSPAMYGMYAGVSKDIDDMPRSLVSPTAGAKERIPPPINAAVAELASPSGLFCKGNYDIKVKVRNKGTSQIPYITVRWEHNGVPQPSVTVNSVIDTFGSVAGNDTIITLGNLAFVPGIAQNIKAWTENPGGAADPINDDDTIYVQPTASLSDTLTIGGTSPVYATFTAAVNALKAYGVCGKVLFNVRPGTYNERVIIPAITGASSANTITFKGSGKANTLITAAGSGTADYGTVVLNGADFITFRDLAITNTGASNALGVMLSNVADSNRFINVKVEVPGGSTASTICGIVFSASLTSLTGDGNNGNYNRFDSMEVTGGYYGVVFRGTSTTVLCTGNSITNSNLTLQYFSGLYNYYHGGFTFSNNTVSQLRAATHYAVYSYYTNSIVVEKNRINTFNGLYFNYNQGGTRSRVVNNMILATTYSLYFSNADNTDVLHNTLVANGSTATNAPLYFNTTTTIVCRNNIVVNRNTSATANAIHVPTAATFTTLNNNNYYSYGGGLAYVSASATYSDLAAWKTAQAGYNQASFSEEPLFVSATDLHLKPIGTILRGANVGVTTDIDGTSRPVAPTIGAQERISYANSAGVSDILPHGFCAGTQLIQAKILNIGNNKINSLVINWELNGAIQAPVSISTPIDTFGSATGAEQTVPLGYNTFTQGVGTNIKVWVSLPNGSTDQYKLDDTLAMALKTGLSGYYTIGALGASYATISDAVNDLNFSGICGPVTFGIQNGTYEEQLKLGSFFTSDPSYTVTFESQSLDSTAVNINWPAAAVATNNYIVQLNQSRNVVFNKLTFERTGTGDNNIIISMNNTKGIAFTRNRFIAPLSTATATYENRSAIYSSDAATEDSTRIVNNYFTGVNGLWFFSSLAAPSKGTVITDNIFNNGYTSIFLKHHQSAIITNNQFLRIAGGPAADYFGVSLENCDSALRVSRNRIRFDRGYGIRLVGCNGYAAQPINILNNTISSVLAANNIGYGISIESVAAYNSEFVNVYHNSVLINTASATGRAFNMAGTATSQANNVFVKNNILLNKGSGYVYYIPNNAFSSNLVINHNNVYAASANIGTYNSTTAIANDGLRSWISLSNQDSLSSNVNVNFTNDTTLLLTGASVGDFNLATPLTAYTTTDILSNTRFGTYFYKGAHEAPTQLNSSSAGDASVWSIIQPTTPLTAAVTGDIILKVRNNSLVDIYSFQYNYDLNGVQGNPQGWSGNLSPGSTVTLNIPNVTITPGSNMLKTWTTYVNTQLEDLNKNNDTLAIAFTATVPLAGTYNVGFGETYQNLKSVADSLKTRVLGGNVVFELTANYSNTRDSFPIVFTSPAGGAYTVTIRPALGVTARVTQVDPGSTNPVIEIDGASNLIFDGRPGGVGTTTQWIIRNTRTATTVGSVFRLIGGATYNQIKYLQLEGQSISSSYGLVHFSTSTSLKGGNSNNLVTNNILRDRTDMAVAAPFVGIYASGSTANPNTGNTIRLNHIFNFNTYGVYLTTASGDNWIIDSNQFYYNRTVASTAATQTAVYLSPLAGSTGYRVHGNSIGGSAANTGGASWKHNGTTAFYGINSGAYNKVTITNNVIGNIEQVNTGASVALRGILHDEVNSQVTISGNTISNMITKTKNTAFSNNGLFAFNGIVVGNADSAWVKNNTIHTISVADVTTTDAITVAGIAVTNPPYAEVFNNRTWGIVNNTQNNSRTTGIMMMNVPAGGTHHVYNNSIALQSNTVVSLSGIMHNANSMQLGTINVFNNSVYIGGTPSSGTATSYGIYRQFATSFNLRNNVVYCERNGNQRAFYDNGAQVGLTADYNFYIQTGNPLNSGATNMSFATWKNLGNDSSGYYATPAQLPLASLFTNAAAGDLSVVNTNSNSWALNGKGLSNPMLVTGLGGNTRSTATGTPVDIGAYEFTPTGAGIEPVVVSATPAASPSVTTLSVYNRPVATINWRSGTVPTSLALKYYSGVPPAGATIGNNINSYYAIEATGGSGYVYDIDLAYTPAEMGTVNEANLSMAKKDGAAAWTHRAGSFVNMAGNTVKDTLLNSFSLFTLTDRTNPLPVTLTSFNATALNKDVLVSWITASERNVSQFVVEVSTDGKRFEQAGKVKANGHSSAPLSYKFIHAEAQDAMNGANVLYYRLTSIDHDGSSSTSGVAIVRFDHKVNTLDAVVAYPNPFNQAITLSIPSSAGTSAELVFMDLQGRIVMSENHTLAIGSNEISLNKLDGLKQGVYLIRLTTGSESKVIRVVKN
ncbi:MAG: T9SS type A sorting domain-containing protein [Bacteroidota bacterium]